MSDSDVEYRGYTIEVQSYLFDCDRWRAKAVVSTRSGGSQLLKEIVAPPDVDFATPKEADSYSVAMAKKWIEEKG